LPARPTATVARFTFASFCLSIMRFLPTERKSRGKLLNKLLAFTNQLAAISTFVQQHQKAIDNATELSHS